MQRLPRVRCLVLGDAVSVLPGMRVLAEVGLRGMGAAGIGDGEPEGASDGGVGTPARSKYAVAVVEPDLLDDRPVDDEQRRAGMRCRLPMGEAILCLQNR